MSNHLGIRRPEAQKTRKTKHGGSMTENKDYSVTFLVDKTPKEAFAAIANVRSWFTQAIEGDTDRLGAVFYYHYQDNHRCTFKITEFAPDQKIVWHVLQNYFKFTKDPT